MDEVFSVLFFACLLGVWLRWYVYYCLFVLCWSGFVFRFMHGMDSVCATLEFCCDDAEDVIQVVTLESTSRTQRRKQPFNVNR